MIMLKWTNAEDIVLLRAMHEFSESVREILWYPYGVSKSGCTDGLKCFVYFSTESGPS